MSEALSGARNRLLCFLAETIDGARQTSDITRLMHVAISVDVGYQLVPLLNNKWELFLDYQQTVIESAGTDVHFIDWSKEPDPPFRKIVIMSRQLPHMREVTSQASFEDASSLCANEPNI